MTPRERLTVAMRNEVPDRVPCAPDISNMIPARLTGKPFWDIYRHRSPPLWKAFLEAVGYFGMDGWFEKNLVSYDSKVETHAVEETRRDDRLTVRHEHATPSGSLFSETTYYRADPPTLTEKPVKDIARDFDKLRHYFEPPAHFDASEYFEARKLAGESCAFGMGPSFPGPHWWVGLFDGGLEAVTYAIFDRPDLMEELAALQHEWCVRVAEICLSLEPDHLLLGASGALSLGSPEFFRRFDLPTIKQVTRMAKEAGVPSLIHCCGRERALVEMCSQETDLSCVNPLERPPMGDCDLAEIKRSFGGGLALMGNLHTTDVMLRGSVAAVERAAEEAIEAAGAGGGFILSTGDQCGRDTPDENIRALVRVAEAHRY